MYLGSLPSLSAAPDCFTTSCFCRTFPGQSHGRWLSQSGEGPRCGLWKHWWVFVYVKTPAAQCIFLYGLPVELCVMSLTGYCAITYRRALVPWPLCQEFLWGHWPLTSVLRFLCTCEVTAGGKNLHLYLFRCNSRLVTDLFISLSLYVRYTCGVISRGHWPLYLYM